MTSVYSVFDYGTMLADRARTSAYTEALRRTIRPDSVVLDLGTGAGIWALVACRLGARHVYAVEPAPVIHLGEQLGIANGYADRITFIRDVSTRVTLPEPVDVVVADIHGVLPLFGTSVASLIDARRFLGQRATMIPREETVWAGVVEDETTYNAFVDPWNGQPLGLDLRPGRTVALNTSKKVRLTASNLLTARSPCCTLDYLTLGTPNVAFEVRCVAERSGTGHGLALWFDSVLAEGVGFSNGPGAEPLIFGQAFFPWPSPVPIDPGDTIALTIRATLIESEYVWMWNSSVNAPTAVGRPKASFQQSTFSSAPLSIERAKREAPDHVPDDSATIRVSRFIFACIDGRTSLREIAAKTMDCFPGRFSKSQEALAHVRSVVNSE